MQLFLPPVPQRTDPEWHWEFPQYPPFAGYLGFWNHSPLCALAVSGGGSSGMGLLQVYLGKKSWGIKGFIAVGLPVKQTGV